MEHIVQFGVSIDDEVIADRINKNAEKVITDNLFKEIRDVLFANSSSGKLTYFAERKIDQFLEENRDKIIESAGIYLAEKLVRTKKGKEILNKYDKD